MAVPTFVQAGTGTTITTGTGTPSMTGCTAGNLVLLHFMADGNSTDWGLDPPSTNTTAIDGSANEMEAIVVNANLGSPVAGNASLFAGRVTANGTVSQPIVVGASGTDLICRWYEFSGVSTSLAQASVFENGGAVVNGGAGTSTDLADLGVTTNGADRLALNFVAINASQALGNFTGETGGDWTEATAEYIGGGTVGTLQLQTATMSSAGTIDGGSQTITSAGWAVIGLALIPPATEKQSFYTSRRRMVGSRR